MNICSLIVHTQPSAGPVVAERLEQEFSGVEVHAGVEADKLVVTVEETTDDFSFNDTVKAMNDVKGVVNTILIYHYGGDETMDEEITK
jgi:periplasmic nitrate reductase NapD